MKKLLVLLVGIVFSCSQSQDEGIPDPTVFAEAAIYAIQQVGETTYESSDSKIGSAFFSQAGNIVTLRILLSGMTPNTSKAVHIHNGSVEEPGRHWNRGSYHVSCNERSLGEVWARPFIGDVGNVPIDADGNGEFVLSTDLWRINSGDEKDILNKTIIVHDLPQDFVEECNPLHDHTHAHSNPKIGGGSIVLTSNVPINTQSVVAPTEFPDFTICN